MTDTTTRSKIFNALEDRAVTAKLAGNDILAIKLRRERDALNRDEIARVFDEQGVDVTVLQTMAVYAVQKVRRMVNAYLGVGTIDPYTLNMLNNARMRRTFMPVDSLAVISSREARQALSGGKPDGMKIRHGASTTASTQVCSTRQALVGLGIATIEKTKVGKDLVLNLEHPLVKEKV